MNKGMEVLIRDWGLPECLKEQSENIDYKFGKYGLINTKEGSPCKDGDARFYLYEKRTGKTLFSMEFWKIPTESRFGKLLKRKTMTLNFLYVDASLRKKGIATHYIKKLRNHASNEEIECINVHANADAKDFEHESNDNALSQEELKKFYEEFTSDKVKFNVV